MNDLDPLLNLCPDDVHSIHIMGICGTGMAALAGMLQQSGYSVRGSDSHVYPPMSDFLDGLGIEVRDGYKPENLEPTPDLVIVGNVITRINPEAQHLATLDVPYLSFPQALSRFYISSRTSLVVTGTHGKTTTCSLLATALHRADLDPTFMIGGILPEFGGNFRIGAGDHFVAEGDEYDTAFFNKVSKFLHYLPKIAIITSLEFDHADIFDDLEAIKTSFREFVSLIPEDGLLIINGDDENVLDIVRDAQCPVQSYGKSTGVDWQLTKVQPDSNSTLFTACKNGNEFGEFTVNLPGEHNCLNALAVAALLDHLGLPADDIAKGLSTFNGVKRRQEVRGVKAGVTVIDDFAHHPTAVLETVGALKHAYGEKRLIIVFEPRTNTSRRAIFQEKYAGAFDNADIVLLREPVPLTNIEQSDHFSSTRLAEDLRQRNVEASAFASTEAILAELDLVTRENDVVAILSNGGFDNIHNRLLELLGNRENRQ